ncbi:MAG: hypothetical protein JSV34_00390 [Candidatus Omnitrophota bacterium]|nr:MAG: hypothetical protein JSV34_00390 [Candidatus Omnitrophota bacterium]
MYRKGILLFEVAFVVLLVSIISLFLFRGFGVFLKAARKGCDYLKLSELSEAKIWDLQMVEESTKFLPPDTQRQGDFEQMPFSWRLELLDSGYPNLNKGVMKVNYEEKTKLSFDTVVFFKVEEQ